ncbi:hypothetical protein [Streptococcus dentiloxodontae]
MFQLTNQVTRQEVVFQDRDELLNYLDSENVRCSHEQDTASLVVSQITEDGSVLASKDLTLPDPRRADALLLGFGQEETKKRGFGLRKERKPKLDRKALVQESQRNELTEPLSAPPTSQVSSESVAPVITSQAPVVSEAPTPQPVPAAIEQVSASEASKPTPPQGAAPAGKAPTLWLSLLTFGLVASLGLTAFLGLQNWQQSRTLSSLKESVTSVQTESQEAHQLDVFTRFFLPNYFSGDTDNLTEFVESPRQSRDWDLPSGTIQSVILEAVTHTNKDTYELSYVVSYRTDEGSAEPQLITFEVTADESSTYGYLVTDEPEMANYLD